MSRPPPPTSRNTSRSLLCKLVSFRYTTDLLLLHFFFLGAQVRASGGPGTRWTCRQRPLLGLYQRQAAGGMGGWGGGSCGARGGGGGGGGVAQIQRYDGYKSGGGGSVEGEPRWLVAGFSLLSHISSVGPVRCGGASRRRRRRTCRRCTQVWLYS
jgi:hypothetical protein